MVGDSDGAVLADGALDTGVEEFFECLVAEFKLPEVFGAVLEPVLWRGVGVAVLAGVVVGLDPV